MVARFPLCERRQLELAVANRLNDHDSHELAEHLQGCPNCRAELEQLAGSPEWWQDAQNYLSSSDQTLPASGPEPLSLLEPELDFLEPADDPALLGKLGSYHIESLIGRGGMGVVVKAQDPVLARVVAIKVLATPLANSAAARKRFAREAKAAAAVVHDHVIPIHSVEIAGPVPFLVMPYVTGRSLQDRLDVCGPLETKEVMRIGMQTALGLAAAHAQGLVHRDIKPANILLENGVERVRITDFGLARAIDDASQTQSGFIAGTPQYMAPEQARGESVDARADLFSLGSVMYAMCTGHPPFRAETTLAVLRRICDDAPRPMRETNPDVPAWLAAIIHKLLAKAPHERFGSAKEIAGLLEHWLAHLQQPTTIAAPAFVDAGGSSKAKRPSQNWLAPAIAVSLIFVMALGAAAWQWKAARDAASDALAHSSVEWNRQVAQAAAHSAAASAGGFANLPAEGRHSSLSPAAIDEEIDGLRAAADELAAVQPGDSPATDSFMPQINELNRRLTLLEQELASPSLPPVRVLPALPPSLTPSSISEKELP